MSKRRMVSLALVLPALACASTLGQASGSEGRVNDVASMANVISQYAPRGQSKKLLRMRLDLDQRVVEEAGPDVLRTLEKAGYTREDATSALVWSWYLLRVGKGAVPLDKELTKAQIFKQVGKLGKLEVNSKPDGAVVYVDGTLWPMHTDSFGFASVGERRIRVERSGAQSAEKVCTVNRDSVTTFSAVLLPTGSKAECK